MICFIFMLSFLGMFKSLVKLFSDDFLFCDVFLSFSSLTRL